MGLAYFDWPPAIFCTNYMHQYALDLALVLVELTAIMMMYIYAEMKGIKQRLT